MLSNYYVPGKEGFELKIDSLLSKTITQLLLLLFKRMVINSRRIQNGGSVGKEEEKKPSIKRGKCVLS